jgi:hypothetical protein
MSGRQQITQREREETLEGMAARRRKWRNLVVFSLAGLVLACDAWIYVWPMLYPRLFPVRLPDEVPIEQVIGEFNDDATAGAARYANKRIVVVGQLVVEEAKPGQAGSSRIFFKVSDGHGEDLEVPVEFFDIDDAGSVDPGDQVALSGLIKREGPSKFRFIGAGQMPVPLP